MAEEQTGQQPSLPLAAQLNASAASANLQGPEHHEVDRHRHDDTPDVQIGP
ncbi:hypothetical protein [Micromonospora saelicesensis]|uniref:hypothetical protein n=1 Tax=Micromonospora saelicesensis TaxID=285676 RepID=UPI001428B7A9|nr:hypothetical protein [Micromonospora saelicesensis]